MSFRLLAHAEFENYIEDIVREIAEKAHDSWKTKRKVSIVTLSMLSFSTLTCKLPPESLATPSNKKDKDWKKLLSCDDNLKKAFTSFRYFVDRKNHGVKEENLLALLLPIGLPHSKLDPLFLTEINDFAGKRGSVAHSSVAGHVQVGVNPSDEASQVDRVRAGFKTLDQELSEILKLA